MKKYAAALAVAGALAVPSSVVAADHDTPGVPGERNCKGQTMAYLAQLDIGADHSGIGNLARAVGLSVQEVKAIVDEFCG